MRLSDTADGYGWISIGLHWAMGIGVVAMWFIGSSIPAASGSDQAGSLRLHTTLGLALYLLFWARIAWRLVKGHPGPGVKQNRAFFTIGKVVHFGLLGGLAVMLVTGPLMAWAGGVELNLFGLALPSPLAHDPVLFERLHTVHRTTSTLVILAIVLHVAGALKHAAFDRDGTLDRILIAAPRTEEG